VRRLLLFIGDAEGGAPAAAATDETAEGDLTVAES
jgi:hypothetical protein